MKHKLLMFIGIIVAILLLTSTYAYADTKTTTLETQIIANDLLVGSNTTDFIGTNTIVIDITADSTQGFNFSHAMLNMREIKPRRLNDHTMQIQIQAKELKKNNTLALYYVNPRQVPLSSNTKHLALMNFIFGLTTIGLGVITLLVHAKTPDLYELNKHYRRILIGVSIAMSVFSSFFFLFTNDLSGSRQWFDQWTILMFIFFVDQLTMTIINYRITRTEI